MATEELLLVVNDAQLNLALTKIEMIKNAQMGATTQMRELSSLMAEMQKGTGVIEGAQVETFARMQELASQIANAQRDTDTVEGAQERIVTHTQELLSLIETARKEGETVEDIQIETSARMQELVSLIANAQRDTDTVEGAQERIVAHTQELVSLIADTQKDANIVGGIQIETATRMQELLAQIAKAQTDTDTVENTQAETTAKVQELLSLIEKAQKDANIVESTQMRTTTQTQGLSSLIRAARRDAREAGISLDDLPTLNRDMRLIMGMLPGFREASSLFFQLRRGIRAGQLEREAAALKDLAPDLARQLGTAAFIGKIALVVYAVTAVIRIAEKIEKMQRQVIQQRGAYETMIRDGLDLTHEEWALMDRERVGWTSEWEAFVEKSKEDFWAAADDFMRSLYVKYTVEIEAAILTGERGVADEFYP